METSQRCRRSLVHTSTSRLASSAERHRSTQLGECQGGGGVYLEVDGDEPALQALVGPHEHVAVGELGGAAPLDSARRVSGGGWGVP
ncbi:unnamed protein product [Arctia plantaginis]|uniref:Uncharacterized protein n=1 Tax=Arctia plantaginis TaxID=874455 RepID=A0A8S1B429_ARCPL|nr:unnamed protein product [Arctia plantaginis]